MQRQLVKSDDLKSVGYDLNHQILEVEFKNNSVYQYSRVPYAEYQNLMSTSSKGTYFSQHIKNNLDYGCRQTHPVSKLLR